ncbi:Crp/Fnr family transcriptional regulator [Paracoccus aerodenitrificans]|uniref:Crp/Fnr family transcriptional regulator n=1 Tax=Paracoccus aerodenitrificans TaxID=3017781 RepID=UPI0022EFDF06|nr:cyclic nucleotide-binding domain-containing protein [Paracoccus aerodenitrificans]WBU62774.1 cyclic nucleotide-binding domain-containing protein [Paracoccus aerodenitrificans]
MNSHPLVTIMIAQIAPEARNSVLLRYLSDDVCRRLLEGATKKHFASGENIFLQGEHAHSVFLITEGWIKLFRVSPGGAEAVVSILSRNRSFGEAVALRDQPYPVSAEAIADTTLIQIDSKRLRRQITSDPELAVSLLSASYVHLQELVGQVEQLKARSGVQRLAEFLVDLADRDDKSCRVSLPYNKTLIAGHLGIQPESLSRAFARLREHGVHIEGSHAVIADIGKLRGLANQDKGQPWKR